MTADDDKLSLTPEQKEKLMAELEGRAPAARPTCDRTRAPGTSASLVAAGLAQDLGKIFTRVDGTDAEWAYEFATAIDTRDGLSPRDTAENMLAVQMVATHKASTALLHLAMSKSHPPHIMELLLRNSTRLMALHLKQQEALGRRQARAPRVAPDAASLVVSDDAGGDTAASEAETTSGGEVVRAKFGT